MGMMRDGWWGPTRTDAGFSLVEVVIAMLLLMVISSAVRPLMITATQSSVSNRELAKANALVSSTVAALRAQFPDSATATSCESVRAVTGEADAETGLTTTVTFPGGCPAQYPGAVTVLVSVARTAAPGTPLGTVSTLSSSVTGADLHLSGRTPAVAETPQNASTSLAATSEAA